MPMTASDYLDIADQRLTTGDVHREAGQASADYASAQVSAIQAVVAALIRLAEAVESLRSLTWDATAPNGYKPGGSA